MPATTVANAAVDLVRLAPLMALSSGTPDVRVALVDGPVAGDHPDLAGAAIATVADSSGLCRRADSSACAHGTFVAGILMARRGSAAPSICPGCTLLVRPVFTEWDEVRGGPLASPADVAQAIVECVVSGARVVNLSAAAGYPSVRVELSLREALDYAAARGTLVVAAAGNQATLGSSEITRHPGVIPVVAYGLTGRPLDSSNYGRSAGGRGLGGPGEATSLGPDGSTTVLAGSSVATAFVTATAALLWSLFPDFPSSSVQRALLHGARRRSVIPPLLDACAAYQYLASMSPQR